MCVKRPFRLPPNLCHCRPTPSRSFYAGSYRGRRTGQLTWVWYFLCVQDRPMGPRSVLVMDTGEKSGHDVKPTTPLFTEELHFIRIKWGGEPSG